MSCSFDIIRNQPMYDMAARQANQRAANTIAQYRAALPVATRARKRQKPTLSIPATRVNGSPTKGNHENSSDQLPKRSNHWCARSYIRRFNGNHRRCRKCDANRPITQLIQAPRVLPAVAMTTSQRQSCAPSSNSPARTASDWAGSNVAASRALKNRAM